MNLLALPFLLDRQGRWRYSLSRWTWVDVPIMHDLVDRQGRQGCFNSPIRIESSQLARQGEQQHGASCWTSCDLLSLHGSLLEEDLIDGIVITWLEVLLLMAPLLLVRVRVEPWYLPTLADWKYIHLWEGINACVPPFKHLNHPWILQVIFKQCHDILVEVLVTEGVVDKAPFLIGTEGKPCLKDIGSIWQYRQKTWLGMHLNHYIGDGSTCHYGEAMEYSLWALCCWSRCPKCQGWPSEYMLKNLRCCLGNMIAKIKGMYTNEE
jgi:hypothetical protein